jgi:hypothetical protein
VIASLAPGKSTCPTSPDPSGSGPEGIRVIFESVGNGAFDKTGTVSGGIYSFASGSGVQTGHYRACGYVTDQAGDFAVRAIDRLGFTVGGTCSGARAKLRKAKRQLRRARRALRRARRQGSRARIRKAKKATRKAKKKVKSARTSRALLC